MVMVSNATGIEVGLLAGKYPGRIGHLFSPGGQRGPWVDVPYALDNGAWPAHKNKKPWDESAWRHLLSWAAMSGQRPLWALVPDVVGDRAETLRRWESHEPTVRALGFRTAFAVQDGMTFEDVPDDTCTLFIGGSTGWKTKAIAPWCALNDVPGLETPSTENLADFVISHIRLHVSLPSLVAVRIYESSTTWCEMQVS